MFGNFHNEKEMSYLDFTKLSESEVGYPLVQELRSHSASTKTALGRLNAVNSVTGVPRARGCSDMPLWGAWVPGGDISHLGATQADRRTPETSYPTHTHTHKTAREVGENQGSF